MQAPEGAVDRRPTVQLAVVPLLAATTAAACAYVFGIALHLQPPRQFAVVLFTLAPTTAVVAAALLLLRARSQRDRALEWATAGLVVASVALILQLISFPAVAPGGGIFGTDGQGSSLLYLGFHLALALGVGFGALQAPRRWLAWFVATGIAVSLLVAQPSLVPDRPVLLDADGTFTPIQTVIRPQGRLPLGAELGAAPSLGDLDGSRVRGDAWRRPRLGHLRPKARAGAREFARMDVLSVRIALGALLVLPGSAGLPVHPHSCASMARGAESAWRMTIIRWMSHRDEQRLQWLNGNDEARRLVGWLGLDLVSVPVAGPRVLSAASRGVYG